MKNKMIPEIIGTGLISLDIVITSENKELAMPYAGGTCGNVLTIMAYLGWKSTPISRLDDSFSSEIVKNDMNKWGVNTVFSSLEPAKATPIIMQTITVGKSGIPQHKYIWKSCPKCGSWLPSYTPITLQNSKTIKEEIKSGTVFFFDRTSSGALDLARHFKILGSIIIFEPSAKGIKKHIEEAIQLSDIVKYSDQRHTSDLENSLKKYPPFIIIETMGGKGLKYRLKNSNWKPLFPFTPKILVDTSGCGDWTTAGIISKLCANGKDMLLKQNIATIEDALNYGQALGAWNCEFEGPRRGMYLNNKKSFQNQIDAILHFGNHNRMEEGSTSNIVQVISKFCPKCS